MLADICPNQPPSKPAARRICIVGEAPGTHERSWTTCQHCRHEFASEWRDVQGGHVLAHCPACYKRDGLLSTPKPLVGPSGHTLNQLLAEAGIDRAACWVGNCCQVQAPGNDISRFKWAGAEIQGGLAQLRADLVAYQPHFCLLLGNTPLRAFKGTWSVGVEASVTPCLNCQGTRRVETADRAPDAIKCLLCGGEGWLKKAIVGSLCLPAKASISDWRGSLFMSNFLAKDVAGVDISTTHQSGNPVGGEVPHIGPRATSQIKCLATYHPAALLREAGLTGVTRFDMARAREEAQVDGLEVPKRHVTICMPDGKELS